jgi:hypothetical protein
LIIEKAKELIVQSRANRDGEILTIRNSINQLENKRRVLENRLLDQTIDNETFRRHSTASTGYLNLGINLYELSQRAREIYLKAKAKDMLKEQKNLMRLVFAKITLDEGKLNWEYSKAFKILSEAVSETNCSKVQKLDDFENKTFEHRKKPSNSIKKDALLPQRPIWLPWRDGTRTKRWLEDYLMLPALEVVRIAVLVKLP